MPARRDAARGAGLLAAGLAPFAAARLLDGGPVLVCPFRAATGLPCPLCGASRAVELAAHGDPGFLQFGAVWVAVLAAVAVAGVVALAGRRVTPPAAPLAAVLAVLGVAWAWALANAGTIAPG